MQISCIVLFFIVFYAYSLLQFYILFNTLDCVNCFKHNHNFNRNISQKDSI